MTMSGICDNIAGIIAGAVIGTLIFCCIIFGVIIFIMHKKHQRVKLKYMASSLNGVERRHSTVPSMEGGLHNTAYVGDPLDSRDVIMMMDTSKKNGSSIRGKTPGHSANLSESFKSSSGIGSDSGVSPSTSSDEGRAYRYGNNSSVRQRHRNNSATLNRQIQDLECIEVELIGKNVSGLGFDVKGNPRDGISISNIHERGAARENSRIQVGDKVISLGISFDHMVYEDALTLLSYASPYPITLLLGKKRKGSRKENKADAEKLLSEKLPSEKKSRMEVPPSVIVTKDSDNEESASGSHEHSDNQSEMESCHSNQSHHNEYEDEAVEEMNHNDEEEEEDLDDDTRRRAPAHLPVAIKSLVESKKSAKQAVDVIEDHTKDQVITPSTPDGSKSFSLSLGAQSALDRILSGDELSDEE